MEICLKCSSNASKWMHIYIMAIAININFSMNCAYKWWSSTTFRLKSFCSTLCVCVLFLKSSFLNSTMRFGGKTIWAFIFREWTEQIHLHWNSLNWNWKVFHAKKLIITMLWIRIRKRKEKWCEWKWIVHLLLLLLLPSSSQDKTNLMKRGL